jgi:hypothetical protein
MLNWMVPRISSIAFNVISLVLTQRTSERGTVWHLRWGVTQLVRHS